MFLYSWRGRLLLTSLSVIGFGPLSAQAIPTMIEYSAGHADLGVAYGSSELELHYHFDVGTVLDDVQQGAGSEFAPNEVYVRVSDSTKTVRPGASQWDFLGNNAGEELWILPQGNVAGVPFFGIATEGIGPAGDWVGGIDFEFTAVTAPAGAHFSLWQTDGFGSPVPFVVTSDGLPDTHSIAVGGHNHYNWGFTAEGVYQIEIVASGTHASNGFVSDTETFWFAVGSSTVIPEPATAGLVGVGVLCLLRRRGART